ncbi:unnamed protein product, partial [Mesorhabditis belari]|uniref:DUF8206 domain-containing protein n=1 Tax=Mesorhabditis belari TaxID=2138241 RepID=A0AAF3FRJ7_9BILA
MKLADDLSATESASFDQTCQFNPSQQPIHSNDRDADVKKKIVLFNLPEPFGDDQMKEQADRNAFLQVLYAINAGSLAGNIREIKREGQFEQNGRPRRVIVIFTDENVQRNVVECARQLSKIRQLKHLALYAYKSPAQRSEPLPKQQTKRQNNKARPTRADGYQGGTSRKIPDQKFEQRGHKQDGTPSNVQSNDVTPNHQQQIFNNSFGFQHNGAMPGKRQQNGMNGQHHANQQAPFLPQMFNNAFGFAPNFAPPGNPQPVPPKPFNPTDPQFQMMMEMYGMFLNSQQAQQSNPSVPSNVPTSANEFSEENDMTSQFPHASPVPMETDDIELEAPTLAEQQANFKRLNFPEQMEEVDASNGVQRKNGCNQHFDTPLARKFDSDQRSAVDSLNGHQGVNLIREAQLNAHNINARLQDLSPEQAKLFLNTLSKNLWREDKQEDFSKEPLEKAVDDFILLDLSDEIPPIETKQPSDCNSSNDPQNFMNPRENTIGPIVADIYEDNNPRKLFGTSQISQKSNIDRKFEDQDVVSAAKPKFSFISSNTSFHECQTNVQQLVKQFEKAPNSDWPPRLTYDLKPTQMKFPPAFEAPTYEDSQLSENSRYGQISNSNQKSYYTTIETERENGNGSVAKPKEDSLMTPIGLRLSAQRSSSRLLDHAARARPHHTSDTLSINETRTWIYQLIDPILKACTMIQRNLLDLDQQKEELMQAENNVEELRRLATIRVTSMEILTLSMPQTVCRSQKCARYERIDGKEELIYRVCHKDCKLSDNERLDECAVFGRNQLCTECSCHINDHERISYEQRMTTKSLENPQKLASQANAAEMKKSSIRKLQRLIDGYQKESNYILFAMATFSGFLAWNGITQKTNLFEQHLQKLIVAEEKKMKSVAGVDADEFNQLLELSVTYGDICKQFVYQRDSAKISLDALQEIRQKLFSLPLNGAMIAQIFDIHVKTDHQDYEATVTRCEKSMFQ